MNSKHTSGPWRVVKGGGGHRRAHVVIADLEIKVIAQLEGLNEQDNGSTLDANARLIAAAPNLLAEAKTTLALILVAQGERQVEFEEWAERVDGLRAAIAKAGGTL